MKTCNILHTLALVCLLLSATNITAQNKYKWTDELALLRSIDHLPEYRSGCQVEQFSSYDRTWGNDDGFSGNTTDKSTKTFRTYGIFTFSTHIFTTNSRYSEYFRRFVDTTITIQTLSIRYNKRNNNTIHIIPAKTIHSINKL